MLTLEQIREQLKDRRLQVVADATGVHYNTLLDIRDNENANPRYSTLIQISNYLERKVYE